MLITWSFLVQWSKIKILSTVAEFVIYHYCLWGFKIHNGKLKKKKNPFVSALLFGISQIANDLNLVSEHLTAEVVAILVTIAIFQKSQRCHVVTWQNNGAQKFCEVVGD